MRRPHEGAVGLRIETLSMPTAALGPENPLPPLFAKPDIHQVTDAGDADEEMRRNIGYGRVESLMPYLTQDGYSRELTDQEHPVAVLENDVLRATFLLASGGRLWSLVHKPTGRELLHRNRAFQPANLALRNAWFAGGVEWNVGTIGHSPLTCEPVHAARVDLPDGTPMLRMWEYERLREVVVQLDCWLPPGSEVLLVHVRIVNPNQHEVPMYWWSNIAVPETPGTRVLAPAESAWQFTYDGSVRRIDVPAYDGRDLTYTTRARDAADYFFELDESRVGGARRWIAALDETGSGLVQTSTDRLRGRKLFLWGTSPGGRHWQQWLSGEDDYLEIQAGLARTQLEHLPMPARESWSWVEAYGLLAADADAVHGDDWNKAREVASASLEELCPRRSLESAQAFAMAAADRPPSAILSAGSGWGALERRLRESVGDSSLSLAGTPFADDSLGAAQAPWLSLLDSGRLTAADPAEPPAAYQVSSRWRPLLDGLAGVDDCWQAGLHRGVLAASAGDHPAAERAWRASAEAAPNAWAYRNLGALALRDGRADEAAAHYAAAVALRPALLPLVLEYADLLLAADDPAGALGALAGLSSADRDSGRARQAAARAHLLAGDLDACGRLLESGLEIADLREGEGALHELWFGYQAARLAKARGVVVGDGLLAEVRRICPVPESLDFRMTVDP